MSDKNNTGSREKTSKSFPAVPFAVLAAVACMQWLPVLSFFFTVPLFAVYFTAGKNKFITAVFAAFALNSAVSVIYTVLQADGVTGFAAVSAVLGSAFFFLPLLSIVFGDRLRFRYRIVLAGLLSAVCWTAFFIKTGAGKELLDMLRTLSSETVGMLYAMIPEGFDRSAVQSRLTSESLYASVLDILLYTILPSSIVMYALGSRIGLWFSSKFGAKALPVFSIRSFYTENAVFYPLVGAMIGIIAGRLFDIRYLTVIAWNIFLGSGLFFLLQGLGIFFFFVSLLRKKNGRRPFFLFVFLALLFLLNGFFIFLGCLLIAGVVELFVPLRSRFDNKDTVDPTPGRGSDHNQ